MSSGNKPISGIVPARNEYYVFANDLEDFKHFTGESSYYNRHLERYVSNVGLTSRYILCKTHSELKEKKFSSKQVFITDLYREKRSTITVNQLEKFVKVKGKKAYEIPIELLPDTLKDMIFDSE
jgi:hypothetical protein